MAPASPARRRASCGRSHELHDPLRELPRRPVEPRQPPGRRLDRPHASNNRGILLRNYRDRTPRRALPRIRRPTSRSATCATPRRRSWTRAGTRERHQLPGTASISGTPVGRPPDRIDTDGRARRQCGLRGVPLPDPWSSAGNAGRPRPRPGELRPQRPAVPAERRPVRFVQRIGSNPGTCTLTCHGNEHNG